MTRVLLVGKFKDISEDVYSNIIFSEYVFIKDSKLNPSANQFSLINHSCDNFVTTPVECCALKLFMILNDINIMYYMTFLTNYKIVYWALVRAPGPHV